MSFHWEAEGVVFDDPSRPTPTASFPPGTTLVTLTLRFDDPFLDEFFAEVCGGFAEFCRRQDQVEIRVLDEAPPVLSARPTPAVLSPADGSLRAVHVDILAEDTCDAHLSVELVSITDSLGNGGNSDDVREASPGTDDRHFLLRAERPDPSATRVYTATYRVLDTAGNATEAVARVTVPHGKGVESTATTFSLEDAQAVKTARKAARAARKAQKQAARAARRAARRN